MAFELCEKKIVTDTMPTYPGNLRYNYIFEKKMQTAVAVEYGRHGQ